ncbi:MAG TPA: hypothetical protein ENJ09_08555 [Planctomycetes bacterium]|nr:hypothetical protein [Planctomycetota bacterium]
MESKHEGRKQRAEAPRPVPGLPAGVQPFEHLRSTVERLRGTWDGRPPLLLTHRSPDPDALGALVGLHALLRGAFGMESEIATGGRIFRAENLTMVRELGLSFLEYADIDPEHYGGAFLVDSQPGFGHTPLPEGLDLVGVFDHHEPPTDGAASPPSVPHYDLRLGIGATSSILYEYLRDAGVELDPVTATALSCGVRFDTADLSMHVTELDTEAYYGAFRRADRRMLQRIRRPVLPASYYRELHRCLARARRLGPLVFGFLGRISNPESVAEMADFFLRMEGCRWTLVGGAHGETYHLSVRTELDFGDAYPLLEAVLDGEGSFGGRGPVAGGQVSLAGADAGELQRLERRLRGRTRRLVPADELAGADPANGTRLTRLP